MFRYFNADTSIVISIFDSPTRQKSNVPPHLLWIFNYRTLGKRMTNPREADRQPKGTKLPV